MLLDLRFKAETKNSTLSELYAGERFLGYVIEDGHRAQKEYGETRIPAGTYEIVQRKEGGFFQRYLKRFGHKWVPWLIKVPDFTYILIHIGNTVRDTKGCLLINDQYDQDEETGDFIGINSTSAYLRLHALLNSAFEQQQKVSIRIRRTTPPKKEPKKPPQPPTPPKQEAPKTPPSLPEKPKEIPNGCWPFRF